jgi:hypothetical protein
MDKICDLIFCEGHVFGFCRGVNWCMFPISIGEITVMRLFCQGVKTVVEKRGYLGLEIDPSTWIGTHNM